MTVTADDLESAAASVVTGLTRATGRDWSAAAGTGEWDARYTVDHVGDCLVGYAAQLAARPTDRYVRFASEAEEGASAADVLEFVTAGSGILGAMVRAAPTHVRAYHPSGMADPEGFAAMGCVELLVHGEDVARGLGVSLDPSRDACARVLARMFPDVAPELAGADPWAALRWATGRIALPDRQRRAQWAWRAEPLGE